jgi:acetate kinase
MPNPVILAINAGSSSIKYSVYEKTSPTSVSLIANASVSGLTAPPSQFSYSLYDPSSSKETESSKAGDDVGVSNHEDAFAYFIEFLKSGKGRKSEKQVLDLKRVSVVCHRIVHGGPEPKPLIINENELHHLDALSDLAPLYVSAVSMSNGRHNYAALLIVRACLKQLKGVQNVAFFDSSFHMTLEKKRYMYPIDPKIAESKGIRKYGFHGLSYAYIINAVASFLGKVSPHLQRSEISRWKRPQ